MIYNTYDAILQNGADCLSDKDAIDYARGMVWDECGCSENNIAYDRYVDTVDGVEVYYDFGADYYFFCPVEVTT
jgi:hypothetical protein